jgi:hypothetical protein
MSENKKKKKMKKKRRRRQRVRVGYNRFRIRKATKKICWLARTCCVDDDGTYAHAFVCILVVCGEVGGFKHCEFVRICANFVAFWRPG